MIWSFLSSQVPLLIYLLFGRSGLNPATCFGQPDIQSLVDCFDSYTVPEAFYNSSTYAIAQPTDAQRNDWKHLIRDLLVIDGSCESIPIPSSLRSIYDVRPFQKYCVLYETTSSSGYYRKGWGLVVVQAHQSQVARDLHFSAPHPAYDLGTPQQAAAVFSLTSARSLLIAGRNRNAFMQPSTCVPPRSSTDDWYLTDPAHNNVSRYLLLIFCCILSIFVQLESFFDASTTIYDWQHATRGCSSSNCAFVQFHGKGSKTCPQDSIFMSSGLGSSPISVFHHFSHSLLLYAQVALLRQWPGIRTRSIVQLRGFWKP